MSHPQPSSSSSSSAAVETPTSLAAKLVGFNKEIAYLADQLSPTTKDPMNVLWAVATTPEMIHYGLETYSVREQLVQQRQANAKANKPAASTTSIDDVESLSKLVTDHATLNETDLNVKTTTAPTSAHPNQKQEAETMLLEGIDDGVIGQEWVERTLAASGIWPPNDWGLLQNRTFDYNGTQVGPLDHPGIRRNICMMLGRLNTTMLNSHPELGTAECEPNIR